MNDIAWIVLLVVVVVIVGFLAWQAGQRRRSRRLQERFGPEYDRTVEAAGKRGDAEADLEAREQRIDSFEIRPLDETDQERFRERWRAVQALFVDDPASAVGQADVLIGDVMRARGYPVGDFERRAADVSVNHPQVVEHYRTAHGIAAQQRAGDGDTEQLRQAVVHYRALFADLLDLPNDAPVRADDDIAANEAVAPAGERPAGSEPDVQAISSNPADEPVTSGSTTEGTPR
jgi:hypothetical protein